MGKDCSSYLNQQHSAWRSPNWTCTTTPLDGGQQDKFQWNASAYNYMVSPNGALPGLTALESPSSKIYQGKETCGWFYCLPRHRQSYFPTSNSVLKENLNDFSYGCGEYFTHNAVSESMEKRLLVFDQTGNRTSLIFSSVIGSSQPQPICGTLKQFDTCGLHKDNLAGTGDQIYVSGPILSDRSNEIADGCECSEMHEDTEELNALLYSDDEYDYGEDDEVASTGHSPGAVMEGFEELEQMNGITEEVASSGSPTKRCRLLDGGYNTSSLVDTASSIGHRLCNESEDDAESTCAGVRNKVQGRDSLSGNKRSRKERLWETVNILQSIIPGGKGKDAVFVLDESIRYLKSLKLKAEELGATTLK